ncbi:MAG: mycothiol system anti-sigma-R factor [Actinomycetota bacterium]|nr:mycothiol system anti-sigma-R factor [Actinomycetota bacterium]
MSCGDPHETDCRDVIEEVYLYLDGELDEEDRRKVRSHLDECSPCLRQYGLEQSVKALVARCCGGEAAPVELRERVMVRLREVRVSIDHMEFRAE